MPCLLTPEQILGASFFDTPSLSFVADCRTRAAPRLDRPAIRANEKRFRVKPNFVFRAHRLAVFVDGCFWHGCPLHATSPKTNAAFWQKKISANRTRDRLVTRTLGTLGWRVLRIWQHELKRADERRLHTRLHRALG